MKILYFHQYFSTPLGAGGLRTYKIAKKLIERGHKVTVVCGNYDLGDSGLREEFVSNVRRSSYENIEIIQINISFSNKDKFYLRLGKFFYFSLLCMKYIFTEKYDMIFATSTPLTMAIPGIIGKCILRKKFIFEIRDSWPLLPIKLGILRNPIAKQLAYLLERISYKTADGIVVLAPGIGEEVKRIVGEKYMVMIPNASDTSYFNSKRIYNIKNYLELRETDFVAIYAGTHGIANGLDSVLHASFLLQEENIDYIKFVLIGDGVEKSRLLKKATKLKLNNIYFIEPQVKKMTMDFIATSDVGLQILKNIPDFYDGTSPNKFFDYLSCNVPVLINYPGWLGNKIKEYNCGIEIAPDNSRDFADALVSLQQNNSKLEVMKINSGKLAIKEFNWDNLTTSLAKFLEAR